MDFSKYVSEYTLWTRESMSVKVSLYRQREGPGLWCISCNGHEWNKNTNCMEYRGFLNSSMPEDWVKDHRFESLDEAMEVGFRAAKEAEEDYRQRWEKINEVNAGEKGYPVTEDQWPKGGLI